MFLNTMTSGNLISIAGFILNISTIAVGLTVIIVKLKAYGVATNKRIDIVEKFNTDEFNRINIQIKSHHDIFYKDGRTLALISDTACKEKRDTIHEKIRSNEKVIDRYFQKADNIETEVKILNLNMLKLMIKFDLDPEVAQ